MLVCNGEAVGVREMCCIWGSSTQDEGSSKEMHRRQAQNTPGLTFQVHINLHPLKEQTHAVDIYCKGN